MSDPLVFMCNHVVIPLALLKEVKVQTDFETRVLSLLVSLKEFSIKSKM